MEKVSAEEAKKQMMSELRDGRRKTVHKLEGNSFINDDYVDMMEDLEMVDEKDEDMDPEAGHDELDGGFSKEGSQN